MYCMTFTRYDLRARGHLIKPIFSHIFAYFGTNLRYILVVIPKLAHPERSARANRILQTWGLGKPDCTAQGIKLIFGPGHI
jgi:hypothetical protein